jgi:hypothetical protein
MDCCGARDWLFNADDPRPERCREPAVAEHLAGCPACRSLSAELSGLADAWRAMPLPDSADRARSAFLGRLPARTLPLGRPARRAARPRVAAAAVILLGIGLGAWLLLPGPEAHAGPAVIERLVDWNLELARAATPGERGEVYAAREGTLKRDVSRARMDDADRALADQLLENGDWLATHDDPIATADRFSAVADRLVARLEAASARKELKAAARYAKLQGLVAERGVADSLERAKASGALNFEQRRRLENLILRDESRMKTLVELLQRNPNLSRKEIRKAIDPRPKGPKKRPDAGTAGKAPPPAVEDLQP